MKFKNRVIYVMTVVLCIVSLAGCSSKSSSRMVNELHFPVNCVSELTISYDEEEITFFESNNDELVIREYMTEDKSSYYAKVDQSDDSLKISEGGKPFFKSGFFRYIEVYLPVSYCGNLTVTTTNGNIDMSDIELNLSTLRIDSTAGIIRLKRAEAQTIYLSSTSGALNIGNLKADQIRLETTRGNTVCESLNGNVAYTSTSGDVEIRSAVGGGTYKANNSRALIVTYSEVTDDLYLFNKNGDVNLVLPKKLGFEFKATTKNGSVSTNFQECITVDGHTTKGTVGNQPAVTVEVETNNGNIEVTQ